MKGELHPINTKKRLWGGLLRLWMPAPNELISELGERAKMGDGGIESAMETGKGDRNTNIALPLLALQSGSRDKMVGS